MSARSDTKSKILEAAVRLFSEREFESVTLQDIGTKIGIRHASIYEHFKSKGDLFLATCQHAMEGGQGAVDSAVPEDASAEERLKGYVRGNLRSVLKNPQFVQPILGLYYFARFRPELRELLDQIDRASVARIEILIKQGVRERSWPKKDPTQSARVIHSMLVGELIKAYYRPAEHGEKRRVSGIWSSVLRILREP